LATASELIREGRKSQIWMKYCGFLDLSITEFMQIQKRLLLEQIELIKNNELGQKLLGESTPTSVEEFRSRVPLTTYEDYEAYFNEKRQDPNYEGAYIWAHTSGRSGNVKWIPYTREGYEHLGERVMAGVILAAAREKGDVHLEEGDILVYNTPPRPFISGIVLQSLAEQFNFHFIPSLDETESMEFGERITKGFEEGLDLGIDVLGSISSVLLKMGEQFAQGAQTTRFSSNLLRPRVAWRLIRGFVRSRLERRPMLPKDLWKIKALPCGGMDTSLYRDQIAYYWGVLPYEQYGSTEDGSIATQAWNKKGMYFFPDAVFLEFIPEDEWSRARSDPKYTPKTVLLDEVEVNKKYEIVITNFFGRPLLRYRTYDLIEFTSLQDDEIGVKLPQMSFSARTTDFIDLAGFTGLIDEKMVWKAILNTGIEYNEWVIRKEAIDGNPVLHLYIETKEKIDADVVQQKVHECLKALNPYYSDYETMLNKRALYVTVLEGGTFQKYMGEKARAGTDLAHLKPAHMNAPDEEIKLLLQASRQTA
jgi:phenylacetate-coenzyme A ligase PaaK-like adenylate-forming protein